MEKNKPHKHTLFFLGAVFLFGAYFFIRYDVLNSVKNAIKLNSINDVIETIHREISTPGALFAKIESSNANLTKGGVFAFTNKERINANLQIFTTSTLLDEVAKRRMKDMFAKGYFEHVSPTGDSASVEAELIGYEYISIGENIALGNFENDDVLVKAWMASPGHRANILNTKFTQLGVAVGKGLYNGKSTWIGVQIFARPLSLCAKLDVNLKNTIDSETKVIDELQGQINLVQAELEVLGKNKSRNREQYNQKVDEYNALAKEINSKIIILKADISEYNQDVRVYNTCIGN
jgi:uncharacterized protein YkwD